MNSTKTEYSFRWQEQQLIYVKSIPIVVMETKPKASIVTSCKRLCSWKHVIYKETVEFFFNPLAFDSSNV